MKKITIIGGSKGLGFSILNKLHTEYDCVYLIDKEKPILTVDNAKYIHCDLSKANLDFENIIVDTDTLIITAGFGYVRSFENLSDVEIQKLLKVNSTVPIRIIKMFYQNLLTNKDKKCMIISSIAGEISSPLFSVYGAAKSSISKLCESLNIELEKNGSKNRITCISAVSFKGSSFNGEDTDINLLNDIANECIDAMNKKETNHYINHELCHDIIERYNADKHEFGLSSYDYKLNSGRVDNNSKKIVVGYLSGTFDLFHIGHLNLLRNAKSMCDYLIVGVHKDGKWKGKETFIPFDERKEIVSSIKYVDCVVDSTPEDSDAWNLYHYDILFVGSDYKGTQRFNRYEEILKGKAKIVYFEYTKSTSSSQMRELISKKTNSK